MSHDITLEPISRGTAADACTAALKKRILDGGFAPGTRLPAERELADELGVNRVTVRSALATLAAERLVKVKHGSGAWVADFLETGGPSLIADLVQLARGDDALAAIADLLAVRRALARVVVSRVVERIDASGRGRITSAVQGFARAIDESEDVKAIAAADLAVIRAIVAEAKSPVLQLCLNPVAAVLTALPSLCAAMFAEPQRSLLAYEMFVDALAHPSPDLAGVLDGVLAASDAETLRRLGDKRRKR